MRTIIILLLLSVPALGQAKKNSIANFRAVRGITDSYAFVRYGTTPGDAMGSLFFWSDTLTRADDGMRYIRPSTAVGGWERSEPLSQKRGTAPFNYTLGQVTYTFAHGLGMTPTIVHYTIKSAIAPGPSSWSATATTISVTFNALPIFTGTVPFTICWVAYPY